MLEKFWTRPPRGRKLPVGEVNARERMTKLCEGNMLIGPHSFEIKCFLVKDEDAKKEKMEKRAQKEKLKEMKKAEKLERERLRELNRQQHMASTGFSSVPKPGFVRPISGSPIPSRPFSSSTSISQTPQSSNTKGTVSNVNTPTAKSIAPSPLSSFASKSPGSLTSTPSKTTPSLSKSIVQQRPLPSQIPSKTSSTIQNSQPPKAPMTPQSSQEGHSTATPNSVSNSTSASTSTPRRTTSTPDLMQTPENHMMIANLNYIARRDASLNTLMKIVASGKASSEQITEFQRYIALARSMGYQHIPNHQTPNSGYRRSTIGTPTSNINLSSSQVTPSSSTMIQKKPRPITHIEKFIRNATIVFEFSESPISRFLLPKDAVVEELPNGQILFSFLILHNFDDDDDKDDKKKETAKEKVNKNKNKHKTTKDNKSENKDKEDDGKEEGDNSTETASEQSGHGTKLVPTNATTKIEHDENEEISEEPDYENNPKYQKYKGVKFTSLTITLYNLPKRLVPVFIHSVYPQSQVVDKMKAILKLGIRAPQYHLWYLLDGKNVEDDELRFKLKEEIDVANAPPGKTKAAKRRNSEGRSGGYKKRKSGDTEHTATPTPASDHDVGSIPA